MKLVIFGSTGKIGIEVVKQALAREHDVTAFLRDPARLTLKNEMASGKDRLRIVSGDVFDASSVKEAVQGQDAVICSIGSMSLGKTTVRTEGTANIIQAMEEQIVDRLLVVSAMGVGESWSTLSFVNKLFFATLLFGARRDHEEQEKIVKKSNLNWTILRPSGLTDGPLTGSYDIGEGIPAESSKISAADVADALIKALDEDTFGRKAVTITN